MNNWHVNVHSFPHKSVHVFFHRFQILSGTSMDTESKLICVLFDTRVMLSHGMGKKRKKYDNQPYWCNAYEVHLFGVKWESNVEPISKQSDRLI